MKITIEPIPHEQQRYPTVGDWTFDAEGNLIIKVSELSDWRREVLVGIHELVEAVLCKHALVTQQMVDEFDMNFEANRKEGDDREPGDDPSAPYVRQHRIATALESIVALELGVNWVEYERELMSLP